MAFADEVTADHPYVWWDTRQASGTAQPDRSGNGHAGTITGSPALSTDGLTFSNLATGDDQYITSNAGLLAVSSYAAFCVETVCDLTTFVSFHFATGIQSLTTPDSADIAFSLNEPTPRTNINCSWESTTGLASSHQGGRNDPPVTTGSLHHIALDFDGATGTVYLDGSVYQTCVGSVGPLNVTSAATPFFIADDGLAAGDGFNGLVRHGIFYTHSLGSTRIAAHATAALTNDSSGSHFTPPTELTVSNIAFDVPPIWNALRKYYPVSPRGRAVWQVPGDPTLAASYTFNQPYPWVTDQDVKASNLFRTDIPRYQLGSSDSNLDHQTIVQVFYGGSTYAVTSAQVTGLTAFLTANGYTPGDWIT